jgi:hypothetical protein
MISVEIPLSNRAPEDENRVGAAPVRDNGSSFANPVVFCGRLVGIFLLHCCTTAAPPAVVEESIRTIPLFHPHIIFYARGNQRIEVSVMCQEAVGPA